MPKEDLEDEGAQYRQWDQSLSSWEMGLVQDTWTSQFPGLSLSFFICTMGQRRLGFPALIPGSKHSLNSGSSSFLWTLNDFLLYEPQPSSCALWGWDLTSGFISLTAEFRHIWRLGLWNNCPVPLKAASSDSLGSDPRQLFLLAQEMSAPRECWPGWGHCFKGSFRNCSISGESLTSGIANLGPGFRVDSTLDSLWLCSHYILSF